MKRTEIVSIFQKKTFGLALTIGAASFVMAQQKLSISGNVKDANGGIGYSSVTFKNTQNAQLSDAVLADVDGNYKLELAPGTYDVTIEAVDYKKFSQTVSINKPGPIAPFTIVSDGKANLTNTTDIQTVVITGQSTKPYKVELDIDSALDIDLSTLSTPSYRPFLRERHRNLLLPNPELRYMQLTSTETNWTLLLSYHGLRSYA